MKVVKISELADERGIIDGGAFSDSVILGPAMLTPLEGTEFNDNTFEGPFEETFHATEKPVIVGVIWLRNVTFTGCTFRLVGIMASPEVIAKFGGDVLESGA